MAEKDRDFQITSEEADRIKRAMKNEKFRELLSEYVDEISNPENRAQYEEQLTKLEKQRGVDLKFIQPLPGFVMKMFTKPEGTKVFINVCQNENVKVATPTSVEERGEQWMIPYSLTPPREDLDKAGKLCSVVDAVFHPETYKKGQENPRFKQLLVATVLDGIEDSLHIKLDRENIIYLRMTYKGTPTATVIREKTNDPEGASPEGPDLGPLKVPYPPLREELEAKSYKKQQEKKQKEKQPSEPEYSVVHRGEMTMQDFTNERSSSRIKRPKELVVSVHLPGVDSAKNVELEMFEKRLLLQCNKPHYKLDLALPYPINDEKGSAKFNKSKKSLIITLPVLPQPHPPPTVTPPTAKPLVTELPLSDTAETTKSTNEMTEEESHDIKEDGKQEELLGAVCEVTKDWSSKGEWLCPPYSYRQDENSVYFVLQTPGIKRPSMAKHFDEHQVQLTYSTDSDQNYSFFVGFPSGCGLDCDDCSVDVSEENVVLVLVKSEESSGATWKGFTVGLNAAQSTDKLFLTADNVQSAVEQITSLPNPWIDRNGWSDSAQFEVVALSDSHMEIKVTDPDQDKKQSSTSKASTATANCKGTTKGSKKKKKKHGPSSPPHTKREAKSPMAELQQGDDKDGKTSDPKPVEGAHEISHTEPTLDTRSNTEGETDGASSSLAQDRRVEPVSKEEGTAELLGNSQSGQDDGDVHKESERKAVSKKKGLGLDSVCVEAAADPNLLVKEDGSVFVNVDTNYTRSRPLDRVTQKQEPKESKFQFSNQLAFSLD